MASKTENKYEARLPQTHSELMEKPRLFIGTNSDGKFELDSKTVELLGKLDTPVVVIGIVGVYRTGKSYLMNLLAGNRTGFDLGRTVESRTKGIWIWCRKHPTIAKTTLIVMDTEGLEDANKGDDNHDMQIVVLTLLLSCTFIFNTVGRIDDTLIKQLGFVSEMSKFVQTNASKISPEDENFHTFLPVLVVTVRDFALELIVDGKEVSASEYFEKCLKSEKSTDGRGQDAEYRRVLDKYFPVHKRHCFVLPQPVKNFSKMWITRVAILPPDEMNQEFLEESEKYLKFITNISQPKTIQRDLVNGRMFAEIAAAYVEALSRKKTPCIQSIFSMTAIRENSRIVKECSMQYEHAALKLDLPLTEDELQLAHAAIVNELRERCRRRIIFQESENFDQQFKEAFALAYTETARLNEESSRRKCEQILENLYTTMKQRVAQKYYWCTGGYDLYTRDIYQLQCQYDNTIRKGVMYEEIWHKFLQSKTSEMNDIVAADKSVTSVQIKLEGASRVKAAVENGKRMIEAELGASANRQRNLKEFFQNSATNLTNDMAARTNQQRENFDRILAEQERNHSQIINALQQRIQNIK